MIVKKPTIAAINGFAVAGGLELACMCDIRVVEEDAVMGVFCRRWGVPLIDGGTVRLPRIIGMGRALDLILTGRLVSNHALCSDSPIIQEHLHTHTHTPWLSFAFPFPPQAGQGRGGFADGARELRRPQRRGAAHC